MTGPSCATGLHVIWANGNFDGFTVTCGRAPVHDWVKAISPETIIFFPLSLNESQSPALVDDSLASWVALTRMTLPAPGVLTRHGGPAELCPNIRREQQCEKHARYEHPTRCTSAHNVLHLAVENINSTAGFLPLFYGTSAKNLIHFVRHLLPS